MEKLTLPLLLWLSFLGLGSAQCSSTSDRFIDYETVLSGRSTSFTLLFGIGSGKIAEINCLSLVESPTAAPCGSPSLLYACRDNVMPENCQSLAEFLYDSRADVTLGSDNGQVHNWLIAFDGRGKTNACYPRSVQVRMLRNVYSPEEKGSSLALSVVAIVLVVLLVVCILLVIAVYFHQKTMREEALEVREDQLHVEDGNKARELQGTPAQGVPVAASPPLGNYAVSPYDEPAKNQVRIDEGFGYGNPLNDTFGSGMCPPSRVSGEDYHYPQPHPSYHSSSPSRKPYSQSRITAASTLYTSVPPSDTSVMAVACADCGSQIGHPNTPQRCEVSGTVHPSKLVT